VPLISVTTGGPDIDPGTYPVTLVDIEGPKVITPQSGPTAGQEMEILVWKFAVDEGEFEGTEIEATTSTNTGPKSKVYGFLTALLGGKPPAENAQFEATDLAGRRALATVERPENGWAKIRSLVALPVANLSRGVAAATGAPLRAADRQRAQPAVNTVRGRVAPTPDGVPF